MIRKFFASIFASFFIVVSIIAILIFALDTVFFDIDFYKGPLLEKLYDNSVSVAVNKVNSSFSASKYFSKDEFAEYIHEAVPFEIIQSEVSKALDEVTDWDFMTPKSVKISLKPFKEKISSVSTKLLDDVFTKVPQCDKNYVPSNDKMPDCLPSNVRKADISYQLNTYLKSLMDMPDEYEVQLPQSPKNAQTLVNVVLPIVENAYIIILILLIIIGSFVALILFKPLYTILKWEGVILILSGVFNLLVSYGLRIALPQLTMGAFLNVPPEYSKEAFDLVSFVLQEFTDAMFLYSGMFLIFGVLSVTAAIILKRRS